MRPLRTLTLFTLLTAFAAPALAQDLLVGSWATHSVRRYDITTGTYLGDFIAPGSGGLNLPDGLAWGPDNNLYVSSSNSNQILRYDGTSGNFIDVFASAGLNAPGNCQFGPDGLLYVCNKNLNQVLRYDVQTGQALGAFVTPGGGLNTPVGLAWKDGFLYVSSFTSGAIHKYDAITGAPAGAPTMVFATPLIARIGSNGNLYVSSHNLDGIQEYDLQTGNFVGAITGPTVDCPVGHVIAPDGTLIMASWLNNLLLRFDESTGAFISLFARGNGLARPNDLLIMPIVCYADCDQSTGAGVLDVFDFLCFQNSFVSGEPYACECDTSTGTGVCDVFDFLCFQNAFVSGCQ
jgi:sugar lactone lactonase YvrE